MASSSHYYSTANFNNPAICKAVNVDHLDNPVYITRFISSLLGRLGEGVVQPNLSCLKTLSTIATTPVAPTARYAQLQLDNQAYAQSVLDNYFYSLSQPQSAQNLELAESEDDGESKDEMIDKFNQLEFGIGRTRSTRVHKIFAARTSWITW